MLHEYVSHPCTGACYEAYLPLSHESGDVQSHITLTRPQMCMRYGHLLDAFDCGALVNAEGTEHGRVGED
eukprot:scaffold131243_cov40-Tisochrysis_lutea.AAC.1